MRAMVRKVPPPAIGGTFVRPSGYRRPRVDEGAVVRVDLDELVEHWTLLDDERELIGGRPSTPERGNGLADGSLVAEDALDDGGVLG
jgi:hypothetical protein